MARRVSPDLRGLASELDTIMSKALEGVARDAKGEMVKVAQRAGGGDGKMSGVGKKGAKINARYDHQKGSRGLSIKVRAVGPWQFVEYPRRGGYRIPKRNGRGPNRRRRGNPRLHTGGGETGWATGPIQGGSHGGRLWWNRAAPDVMKAAGDDFADALIKVITGKWR